MAKQGRLERDAPVSLYAVHMRERESGIRVLRRISLSFGRASPPASGGELHGSGEAREHAGPELIQVHGQAYGRSGKAFSIRVGQHVSGDSDGGGHGNVQEIHEILGECYVSDSSQGES